MQFGNTKTISGQVPWDSTTSSNVMQLTAYPFFDVPSGTTYSLEGTYNGVGANIQITDGTFSTLDELDLTFSVPSEMIGQTGATFILMFEDPDNNRDYFTYDVTGLTLAPDPRPRVNITSDTTNVTISPSTYATSKTATGQVPYDTTAQGNVLSLALTTSGTLPTGPYTIEVFAQGDVMQQPLWYVAGASTIPQSIPIPLTSSEVGTGKYITVNTSGANDPEFSIITIDTSALTLEAAPQTLTISIPENTEEIGYLTFASTTSILSRDLFRRIPGRTEKVGTLTDIDSKTKQLSSDRSLYSMRSINPLNSTAQDQNSMSGVIVPIKITRLDSTYTAKFKKGASATEKPIVFGLNDIGYVLTGPTWANDWPYYINVYNSSNELIDTYIIQKTGSFNTSISFDYTKIANLYSTSTADLYYRTDALPNGTDTVPGIEDANGNSVPVSTFQENLVIPSTGFAGQFTSGTIHYVQGLKYSDTQTALDDGYYIVLKVPQYTGSDAQYLSRIRYGMASKWEAGCDISNPSASNTPAITKPISMEQTTITRRIENIIYQDCVPNDGAGQIFVKNQQPNLTFDPIPT